MLLVYKLPKSSNERVRMQFADENDVLGYTVAFMSYFVELSLHRSHCIS